MAILDELLRATALEIPPTPDGEFWERVVRATANEGIVTADEWDALSEQAQAWANRGMRVIKARRARAAAEAKGATWDGALGGGKVWEGDLDVIEFEPLVAVEDPEPESAEETPRSAAETPEPEPEPTEEPTKLAPKRPARKKATTKDAAPGKGNKKKAAKRSSKRRPAAFKAGRCYWFIYRLVTEVENLDECDPAVLLERFERYGITLTKSSANMMMYDTLTVLRVLRDLGRYTHPLMSAFPQTPPPEAAE